VDASQGGGGRQVGLPVDRHSIVKTWRSEAPPGPGRTPDEFTVGTTSVAQNCSAGQKSVQAVRIPSLSDTAGP
jgi:hypothetical protein